MGKMQLFKGELHIHSVLSPCANLDMGPHYIVERARENGINFIGVTDHNSAKNLRAFKEVCNVQGIELLCGIEVETVEEVHMLCYFDSLSIAERFGDLIRASLLQIPNKEDIFGYQVIIDKNEEIIAMEDILLIQRSSYTINDIYNLTMGFNGICVPAHVDRPKNGLLRTLGFLPTKLDFPFLEVSNKCNIEVLKEKYKLDGYNLVKGSDAHQLEDFGNTPLYLVLEKFNLEEILMAFKGEKKRKWFQKL